MKLQVPFVQLPLRFDASTLAAEIEALGEGAWRPHPQGFAGNSALLLITRNGDPDDESSEGVMRPTPHLQRCPYLRQVLGSLGAVLGRTRLMRLSGQSEATAHVDTDYYWHERMRVHVPILTQPGVRFFCGDAEVNMAAGECWLFDTWRRHRVLNAADEPRIHLVADTVGGDAYWSLVAAGRAHDATVPGWRPRVVAPDPSIEPNLVFEAVNLPVVMSPWEAREHITFVLEEALPNPRLAQVFQLVALFLRRWQALWAQYGESRLGWPEYRATLGQFERALREHALNLPLRNQAGVFEVLDKLVLRVALADRKVALRSEEPREPAPVPKG